MNRKIVLQSYIVGEPKKDNFKLVYEDLDVDTLPDDQILIQTTVRCILNVWVKNDHSASPGKFSQ